MRDLCNNITAVKAIIPAAAYADNTPIVSSIIDHQGYDSVTFLIVLGALVDGDATWAVTMDHGNDPALADATAVTDPTMLLGGLANAGFNYASDNGIRKVGYIGGKRYVRLTITPTNNSLNAFISALAILGHPEKAPTPNPPV